MGQAASGLSRSSLGLGICFGFVLIEGFPFVTGQGAVYLITYELACGAFRTAASRTLDFRSVAAWALSDLNWRNGLAKHQNMENQIEFLLNGLI